MTKQPELYMMLLGCKPKGRHTEQHDIFFCIAENFESAVAQIKDFWPDAGSVHIDAWRLVKKVEGYLISVLKNKSTPEPSEATLASQQPALFFINLGGYRPGEFEEWHYKILSVGISSAEAIKKAKATAFYKHTGFKGAESHVDDKYGIDVDDLYKIDDILPPQNKSAYRLLLTENTPITDDEWHIGYLNLSKY